MTRINLLPWREARRQQQQRNFVGMIGLAALIAAAGVFMAHLFVADMIEFQESRNQYLEDELTKLKQVEREINEMKQSEERLRARLDVIQKLQSVRNFCMLNSFATQILLKRLIFIETALSV